MDHQVQHGADIGRSERKRRRADRFNILWLGHIRQRSFQGRVETLDMPDLQNDAASTRRFDQLIRLCGRDGQRLFHQQVNA